MRLLLSFNKSVIVFAFLFFLFFKTYSQCSPQTGSPPSNSIFNTGSSGAGTKLPPGAADLNWQVAQDSINGTYQPATIMDTLPPGYFKSIWSDCTWISTSSKGTQSGPRTYFYKMNFDLPCKNTCGISYDADNSFCLSLDFLADNSIYEIYVNGVPQSKNLGNIIPVADPYNAAGADTSALLAVSLCHNWKAGPNTLIVEIASSPPLNAMLVQASQIIPPNISSFTVQSICQGNVFDFAGRQLSKPGYFLDTIHHAPQCDSVAALRLNVSPLSLLTVNESICTGQSYLGYSNTGIYIDTFQATNGCDSIRTLNLSVLEAPKPDLGSNTEICKGDSLILSPGKFQSYQWQDLSTLDHYVAKKAGLYSVTVTDTCGSATAQVSVTEKNCYINFPNAFTPNKDGKNEYFKILTSYILKDYGLSVYNRWGEKVFETRDQHEGWDGNLSGNQQPAGAYVWYCRFTKDSSLSTLKGTVMLIR